MLTADQVRSRLRADAKRLGGQKVLADKMGMSDAYLSDILAGKRDPSAKKLLDYYKLERHILYADRGKNGARKSP